MKEILPDLSEGGNSGTIVNILVSVGDAVAEGQDIIEVETDKAIAGVPATSSGTVQEILIEKGQEVSSGEELLVLSTEKSAKNKDDEETDQQDESDEHNGTQESDQTQESEKDKKDEEAGEDEDEEASKKEFLGPPATPSLRKLAKEIGLDLEKLRLWKGQRKITITTFREFVTWLQESAFERSKKASSDSETPDYTKWGAIDTEPLSNRRVAIARSVNKAWREIPHVTQHYPAVANGLLAFIEERKDSFKKEEAKLSLTAVVAAALAELLEHSPKFNSSLDSSSDQLILKGYISIGVAVDTEDGLLVPVLKNVQDKDLLAICKELEEMAKTARDQKLTGEDLEGGTFTLSNIGGIGGTYFTPIIHYPEVAILGVGKAFSSGKSENREESLILPLSLSYDHRVIDGAEAARFLKELEELLNAPGKWIGEGSKEES
ncbi:MAG: 2-oxo acid dehydrogenase subunit E2 [Bdellovibrionales bacterium]|nr:2-oxo acid dehydrogenase subunit E2 [Bdellovibrionales bacterium]